jgi:hypothetical protein
MAENAQRPSGPTYSYVDLPEMPETFADSVHALLFDGQMLKITCAVNRMDAAQSPNQTGGKRYPACRLVLTATGAAELINQVTKLGAAIAKSRIPVGNEPDKEK